MKALVTAENTLNLTVAEGVSIVGQGLIISEHATFEACESAFVALAALNRVNQWCLGDLMNGSEERWGDKYSQMLDTSGLDYSTLQSYASIAKSFAPEERRNISFEHHRVVQRFGYVKRGTYLGAAIENNMRVPEFRQYVKQCEGKKSNAQEEDDRTKKFVVARMTAPITRANIWEILADVDNKTLSEEDLFQLGIAVPTAQDEVLVICVRYDVDSPDEGQAALELEQADISIEKDPRMGTKEVPFG